MKLAIASIFAVSTLLSAATSFAAPPRSRVAAEAALPGDQEVIATIDAKTARSTDLFKKYFPLLLKEEGKAANDLAELKKLCGIDLVAVVDDVTVGVDEQKRGAAFVALKGLSQANVLDCASKLAKAGGAKLTFKKVGFITQISSDKNLEKNHFAWLPGDVLVISTKPEDRAELQRLLDGHGSFATSSIGQLFAKVPAEAAIGLAWTKSIREKGIEIQRGSLSLGYASKAYNLKLAADVPTADEAEKTATLVKMAPAALGALGGAPPVLEKLARSITAKANGKQVEIGLSAPEADVLAIAKWAEEQSKK
jgi:hypothetical protein